MKNETTDYIRPKELAEMLCISDVTLWRLSKEAGFPQKHYISKRAVAYKKSEVESWVDSRTSRNECAKQRQFVVSEMDMAFFHDSLTQARRVISEARVAGPIKTTTLVVLDESIRRLAEEYK